MNLRLTIRTIRTLYKNKLSKKHITNARMEINKKRINKQRNNKPNNRENLVKRK